jgi:hypothetical protein
MAGIKARVSAVAMGNRMERQSWRDIGAQEEKKYIKGE